MTKSYSDILNDTLGVPFSYALILAGLDRCDSLDDDSQSCLYASIVAGSIAEAQPHLEDWLQNVYMPSVLFGMQPQPIDDLQAAGEVLMPTCIGDVMKALGRTPKKDPLDNLDIWSAEDLAMLQKVWK